jgi:hypothetical protein
MHAPILQSVTPVHTNKEVRLTTPTLAAAE